MSLQFDKDEIKITELIKDAGNIFNEHEMLGIVSFRADLAEMMLDARIESAVTYGGLTPEEAEEKIVAELAATKREI